ncbi:MAG: TonB-dependent receptor plug domain-containing protein, partial [Solitalea sp.]
METLQRCSRGLMLAAITCMMLLQSAVAQETRQITGTVTDSAGAPLPGVSIVVKGTQNGTSTDLNGKFSIQAAPSDILEFSLLGYLATERPVGTAAQLDVQLEMAGYQLSDVVVIGYQTASRRSVTTSIASVSAEDIQSQVTGNVANAIQGKLPGVQILPGSGLPGSQPTILIRGLSSLTGNTTPLIIVDGIEMGYNALNFLNPSDIQRIDVLKDASASAIYGSRAGQGVILITTKKGGGKPVIQVE